MPSLAQDSIGVWSQAKLFDKLLKARYEFAFLLGKVAIDRVSGNNPAKASKKSEMMYSGI